jgi:hypothetical protein
MELIRQLLGEIIWFVMCWLWSYPQIWGLDKIFWVGGMGNSKCGNAGLSTPLRSGRDDRVWVGVGRTGQRQQQIPYGDDNKKGNSEERAGNGK